MLPLMFGYNPKLHFLTNVHCLVFCEPGNHVGTLGWAGASCPPNTDALWPLTQPFSG